MTLSEQLVPFAVEADGAVVRGMRGGEGKAALLLHGTAGSWRNFGPWLPVLLPRCEVFIPDLPGFGESPTTRRPARLDDWAKVVNDASAQLGVRPRVLVGLGIGASVALAWLGAAGGRPLEERPDRLVLYAPLLWPGAVRPRVRHTLSLLLSPALFPLWRSLTRSAGVIDWWVRHLVAGPDAAEEDIVLLSEDYRRTDYVVLRSLLLDALRRDFRPTLRLAGMRTLVIVGENDPFVDAGQLSALESLDIHVAVQSAVTHGWTGATVAEQHRLIERFLNEG